MTAYPFLRTSPRSAPAAPCSVREAAAPRPPRPASCSVREAAASRSGMTLVELIAALSIFSMIALILFSVLEATTQLWQRPASDQNNLAAAEQVLDTLAADLRQAVGDGANITNGVFFAWDPPERPDLATVHPILRFLRPASPHLPIQTSESRLSLDCVTYSLATGMLYRSVTVLRPPKVEDNETMGDLLKKISATGTEGSTISSLLAERVCLTAIGCTYTNAVVLPLETNLPPMAVNLSLTVFSEDDWATFLQLYDKTSDEAVRRKKTLGVSRSRMIDLPAFGGGALP